MITADPLARLGRADELEQIHSVHPSNPIEVGLATDVADLQPLIATVINQLHGYMSLKYCLVYKLMLSHQLQSTQPSSMLNRDEEA